MHSKYAQRGIEGQRGNEHFQSCKEYIIMQAAINRLDLQRKVGYDGGMC